MICPECGAEYQPGFTRCSDCMVDLVEPAAVPAAHVAATVPVPEPAAPLRAGRTPGWRPVLRWLLAAVLVCFVALRLVTASFDFMTSGQSTSYYVGNALIDLVPVAAEAVAVVLALRGRGGRLVWGILLACGLALLAVQSFYGLTGAGFGTHALEGAALVALALLQLPRSAALSLQARDAGEQGVVHS
jgi:hypothetical protein